MQCLFRQLALCNTYHMQQVSKAVQYHTSRFCSMQAASREKFCEKLLGIFHKRRRLIYQGFKYQTSTIITRSLYILYPHFSLGLILQISQCYRQFIYKARKFFFFWVKNPQFIIESSYKSRAVHEVHLCTLTLTQYSRAISNQERVIVVRVQYLSFAFEVEQLLALWLF